VGDDTKSFPTALIHALRHDPDVIVIGEMRDLDTISTAIRQQRPDIWCLEHCIPSMLPRRLTA
jgi:Tfp pilus assembly ATPase PilU